MVAIPEPATIVEGSAVTVERLALAVTSPAGTSSAGSVGILRSLLHPSAATTHED
jgi:hypothetical protein